ncbi:Ubiquitin-conjugating enzyme E2 1 [Microbotryomycetes sp. JL221]|nr:Ubiquitin-conjugating enzyme E2 1 [Microbotryomycetes sp. JL221]
MSRNKRLAREVLECQKDADKSGISLQVVGNQDELTHFAATFPGPVGTSYEGGTFKVDIEAPAKYPFEPLKMKFATKVYHPNVSSSTGFICLDILKTSWSPVYTLRTCLVSLQSLLSTPEPNDPQDAEVAKHYLTDRQSFDQTAKYWTQVYAGAKPTLTQQQSTQQEQEQEQTIETKARLAGIDLIDVQQFVEMGFETNQILQVLKLLNYRGENKQRIGQEGVLEKLLN